MSGGNTFAHGGEEINDTKGKHESKAIGRLFSIYRTAVVIESDRLIQSPIDYPAAVARFHRKAPINNKFIYPPNIRTRYILRGYTKAIATGMF